MRGVGEGVSRNKKSYWVRCDDASLLGLRRLCWIGNGDMGGKARESLLTKTRLRDSNAVSIPLQASSTKQSEEEEPLSQWMKAKVRARSQRAVSPQGASSQGDGSEVIIATNHGDANCTQQAISCVRGDTIPHVNYQLIYVQRIET